MSVSPMWFRRCDFVISYLALTIIGASGCGYRYANLYVRAVRKDTQTAVSMNMYSGISGLHLGSTGDTLNLRRRAGSTYPPVSIIVRGGSDGCPTYWQIVKVERWGKSPQEAGDAIHKNEVQFIVNDADVDCHR